MAMRIEARSSDPAPGSRGFPWPVLERGNSDFAEGVYAIELEHAEVGKSFELTHEISGAALITRWIAERKVLFACAVAAPASAYRKLHVSEIPAQSVGWDPDDFGEPPKFTPLIVAARDISHTIDAQADGVHSLWDGRRVELPKGARLALFPPFALQSGMMGLLKFHMDEKMDSGRFRVQANNDEGFKIDVHMAKDLFAYLQRGAQRQDATGANVMTHIVSAALNLLKREYSKDDEDEGGWSFHPNLRALAEHLENNGLPHWSDDGFRAEEAATSLYPHKLREMGE